MGFSKLIFSLNFIINSSLTCSALKFTVLLRYTNNFPDREADIGSPPDWIKSDSDAETKET